MVVDAVCGVRCLVRSCALASLVFVFQRKGSVACSPPPTHHTQAQDSTPLDSARRQPRWSSAWVFPLGSFPRCWSFEISCHFLVGQSVIQVCTNSFDTVPFLPIVWMCGRSILLFRHKHQQPIPLGWASAPFCCWSAVFLFGSSVRGLELLLSSCRPQATQKCQPPPCSLELTIDVELGPRSLFASFRMN